MSSSIEATVQGRRQEIGGFGFDGSFTHRIMLGDLPIMPLDQFALYASQTVVDAFSCLNKEDQQHIRTLVQHVLQRTADMPIRPAPRTLLDEPKLVPMEIEDTLTNKLGNVRTSVTSVHMSSEIWEAMDEAEKRGDRKRFAQLAQELDISIDAARGTQIQPRAENPFMINNRTVTIEHVYNEIHPGDFTAFVLHILMGGWFGWDKDLGIPQSAYDALQTIKKGLAIE